MKKIKILFLIGIILFAFGSCTMEKRHYSSGFYIQKIGHNQSYQKITAQQTINSYTTEETVTASTDNSIILATQKPISLFQKEIYKNKKLNPIRISSIEDCDILTLKNGEELKVKVLEIGQSEIKYKKCDNQNGPTISIRKSEVFSIKYPNGSKDIITTANNSSISTDNLINPSGDKSLIVTLILWFFLGFLGIHRFYLGHYGMGLLYLFTGALCGIGLIIDIILLLTGGLKPKNGEFKDKF